MKAKLIKIMYATTFLFYFELIFQEADIFLLVSDFV